MKFTKSNGVYSLDKKGPYRIDEITPLQQFPTNPNFLFSIGLQSFLQGKNLLLDELPFPINLLQKHYEEGYIQMNEGVSNKNNKFTCNRCSNEKQHLFHSYECARCQGKCAYCRKCIMMGRVTQCTPLITWRGPTIPINPPQLQWGGTLTPQQQEASDKLIQTISNNSQLIVWAVCGSGKTEILFKGIELALQQGKRVCLTTPRTDVVLELSPRLKAVFPSLSITTLYGGSEDKNTYSPFVIATTHQLLRFKNAFDVIIVDEVDAFPYSMDESLQKAVENARKIDSALIYLTATPNFTQKQQIKSNKLDSVIIPARYHRHTLPTPTFQWCGNYKKLLSKQKLPNIIEKWIKQYLYQKPMLLFVPHVETLYQVTKILKELDNNIEGVHAEDLDRKHKVQTLRMKEIPMLVTTTILERGVTIENVQVAVLGAEDEVFSESALVQIAGRAGRSRNFPNGDVTFFHYGKSDEMVMARKHIMDMNAEAMKRGLIDE